MKNSIESELKKLQTLKSKLEQELSDIKRQKLMLGEQTTLVSNQLQRVENDIKKLVASRGDGLIVSEHAMLRYIERVVGINPEEIKAKIATPSLIGITKTLGSGTYPIDGFKVKVVDGVIVTVLSNDQETNHKKAG
ncbi:MAG: hypothetical protein PHE67_03570 [Campylobacterales bacterium]|nr:hypothetical protein [Campylobacterales bacterium]